ncbi:MAG TPA: hypothetical protein VFT45_22695 [Longimicrobium sp.]|nr:hypothetical protein [Longimicrobium sp.]
MTMTAPAAAPAASLAQHSFRRGILESEKTYTLYPDRLEITQEGAAPDVYDLSQVDTVHLKYERSKQRAYYFCIVRTPRGKVLLRHLHFAGIARFEDRSATYTPFVRALLSAVAQQSPRATLKAGSLFTFIMLIVLLPFLLGVAALAYSFNSLGGALGMVFMALLCIGMIPRSRPRTVDPANPPANVLP